MSVCSRCRPNFRVIAAELPTPGSAKGERPQSNCSTHVDVAAFTIPAECRSDCS